MGFRKVLSKTLAIACLFTLMTANATDVISPTVGKLQWAPLNPEFTRYLRDRAQGLVRPFSAEGHGLGYIPAPFKLPKVNDDTAELPDVVMAIPASYDLRSHSGMTAVRNQGTCGSCWTFATYASMESYLKFKQASTRDFAEQDLNQYHGFSFEECEGGNRDMSTAYLARWGGPINEVDMPYPYAAPQAVPGAVVQKHVQNVWFLPGRSSYTANSTIKNAIMANGAIYCDFYWDDMFYNSAKRSYYNYVGDTGNAGAGGHAVAIIGWDDSYAKTNFNVTPAGNGAFLIKNSWGTGWGNSGYFWISYYDETLDDFTQFLNAEPTTTYKRVYEYDPLGWTSSLGYSGVTNPTMAYGANIFKAATTTNANRIKAVSFYTPVPSTKVSISVYKNLPDTNNTNPKAGTIVGTTLTKTIGHAGYNTVTFTTPYVVTAGKKFSVVIKFTTPGYNYPVPTEDKISGYTDSASAWKWQGFISYNGTTWKDMHVNVRHYSSICIKAFAGN
jgi:C1A family cysteine protease